MTTIRAALRIGAGRLAEAGVPGAGRDARLLMQAALGIEAGRLVLVEGEEVPPDAATAFGAMLAVRARRQPVAQILGRRSFWGRDFRVTPDVLDPRPETETLVAAALKAAAPARLLDLGTGSGAILVTLLAEWPAASGLGVDRSLAALAIARGNAARHGVAERAEFIAADWTRGIEGRFELVVCNPPYIGRAEHDALAPDVRHWEPRLALVPGASGLEAYRAIATDLARVMAPGGRGLFEIGAGQAEPVAGLFAAAGFVLAGTHADLDGRARVVELRRS
ncbi:peptide chain release factor N(5)-glutamine methyltransferase [soil metagenome]